MTEKYESNRRFRREITDQKEIRKKHSKHIKPHTPSLARHTIIVP